MRTGSRRARSWPCARIAFLREADRNLRERARFLVCIDALPDVGHRQRQSRIRLAGEDAPLQLARLTEDRDGPQVEQSPERAIRGHGVSVHLKLILEARLPLDLAPLLLVHQLAVDHDLRIGEVQIPRDQHRAVRQLHVLLRRPAQLQRASLDRRSDRLPAGGHEHVVDAADLVLGARCLQREGPDAGPARR